MAKKVEVKKESAPDFVIDDTIQERSKIVIENPAKEENYSNSKMTKQKDEKTLVNCLRNEKVIVRFVPRETAMVHDPKHTLYGGMARNAERNFVVPILSSTGIYKNILTDEEKDFLEYAMGLEPNTMSIYKKKDNFWDDSNPHGIGRVTLHKQDNYFDLSNPEDYIKVKILLANKDQVAPSLQELEDRPKATYQFVVISENAETASNLSRADATMNCYMEYGQIRYDADTLRMVIELFEGRPVSNKVKLDYLQGKGLEYIQKDSRKMLKILQDKLLPAKVLIKKCVDAGLIGKKNDAYYLRKDGTPLCEMNEESTLNNAAKYISSVKRQELKYSLEAQVKE